MENFNNFDSSTLDDLILKGAVEVDSIDDNGNFLYKFTEDAKDLAPDIFNKATDSFYNDLLELWTHGFVSMDFTSANPLITITEKAFDMDEVIKLSKKLVITLGFIIEALKIKNEW